MLVSQLVGWAAKMQVARVDQIIADRIEFMEELDFAGLSYCAILCKAYELLPQSTISLLAINAFRVRYLLRALSNG